MQIKVFQGSPSQTEEQINAFLKDNNANLLDMYVHNMHDNYPDGSVCNQWIETTILYEIPHTHVVDDKWISAYRQFIDITLENFPDEEKITQQVAMLYDMHKGDAIWDEAWKRWNDAKEYD